MSDFQREQRKNEHVEIAMAQSDAMRSDLIMRLCIILSHQLM